MATLTVTVVTPSCPKTKALFHGLGTPSPRLVSAFCFSDSDRFGFSNSRFLQTLQNKAISISPVNAVPSKQEDKPRAQQTEETKFVGIQFQLEKDCIWGEQIFLARGDPETGSWDLPNALPMTSSSSSEEHQRWWFAKVDVAVEESIYYKYFLKSTSGDVIWQPGPGQIVKTWPSYNRITISDEWGHAQVYQFPSTSRFEFPYFLFIQTVENKGISPVHAVPSEPVHPLQEDYLETEGPQTEVRIQFLLKKEYMSGEQLLLVRDDVVGYFDLKNAIPMTWSQEHQRWFAEQDMHVGKLVQYKFALKSASGDYIWEPGFWRFFMTCCTFNRLTIWEEWLSAEAYTKLWNSKLRNAKTT